MYRFPFYSCSFFFLNVVGVRSVRRRWLYFLLFLQPLVPFGRVVCSSSKQKMTFTPVFCTSASWGCDCREKKWENSWEVCTKYVIIVKYGVPQSCRAIFRRNTMNTTSSWLLAACVLARSLRTRCLKLHLLPFSDRLSKDVMRRWVYTLSPISDRV